MSTMSNNTGISIDRLRQAGSDIEADALQFEDGRCRVCDKLAGGDRRHRCWADRAPTNASIEVTGQY